MSFEQPRLPYAPDALAPTISQMTVEFHYGKHEKAYIDNLNRLVKGTEFEELPLEEIIMKSDGPLFNNASQAWNHIFYFFQFNPQGQKEPSGLLLKKIEESFNSLDELKKRFEEAGATIFGSGWVWLSTDKDGQLLITQGKNAENPLTSGLTPLLVFDVWEHAYYLDYQNNRAGFLDTFVDHLVNWEYVLEKLKLAK